MTGASGQAPDAGRLPTAASGLAPGRGRPAIADRSYVTTSYSDASGGQTVAANDGTSQDGAHGGNNTNWDFINISGTVYTDEGTTDIGASKTVRIAVNGTDFGTRLKRIAGGNVLDRPGRFRRGCDHRVPGGRDRRRRGRHRRRRQQPVRTWTSTRTASSSATTTPGA